MKQPDYWRGQYKLVTQKPKPKEIGYGVLNIDRDGSAQFFLGKGDRGSCQIEEIKRIRIEFAAAHGIMISGLAPKGYDKRGVAQYSYQEWWLVYPEVKT